MSQGNVTSIYNMDDQEDIIPKAVITVAVIVVAFALGLLVAKLVDMYYDRRAIRDDASDISEYTRNILKAQFMMAFNRKRKKDGKEDPEDIARRMVKLWRIGVVKKKRMRKIEAKKRAEAEKAGKAGDIKDSKEKDKEKGKDKKGAGKPPAPVAATVITVNEKEPPKAAPSATGSTKPDNSNNKSAPQKAEPPKIEISKETKPEEKKTFHPIAALPIVSSDPNEKEDIDGVKNGAKPTPTFQAHDFHQDFVVLRADSDDLIIPVSKDQDPKTVHVTSGRRNSGSSKSDYEFLHDSFASVRDPEGVTRTPSSLSAVKLESKNKAQQSPRKSATPPPKPPKPESGKSRAAPLSSRPPLITPTGRRVTSGKIVTPQGVKVVSRPKTPATPTKN